jgi:hypothetical protein
MPAEQPNTEPGIRRDTVRPEPLEQRLASVQPPPNPLASPEFGELRALRRKLGRGGLPSVRTPEDDARIAAYVLLSELLRGLDDFRGRVQRGERVRLAMREEPNPPGVIRAEFAIETVVTKESA